jgi:hypothetical protein
VKQPTTLNPYIHFLASGFQVLRRLRWDLSPESWRSRAALKAMRDQHAGKKAVVVCNGPSLLKTDLALLRDQYCFGLNKINLLFDRSDFRPSCIVAINPFVIAQNAEFYRTTPLPLFLDSDGHGVVPGRPNVVFLHRGRQVRFARDVSVSFYDGATVTFVALQIAYHMGFRDVALIGCDHNFAEKGPANKTVVSGNRDESHFDPRYFAGGVQWQLPDLDHSEVAYILARQAFSEAGGSLVNATVGGKLEILPRISLESFLQAE